VAGRSARERLLDTLANALAGWILRGLWLALSCCSPWPWDVALRLDCFDELHVE
jgi:hypothetical protein